MRKTQAGDSLEKGYVLPWKQNCCGAEPVAVHGVWFGSILREPPSMRPSLRLHSRRRFLAYLAAGTAAIVQPRLARAAVGSTIQPPTLTEGQPFNADSVIEIAQNLCVPRPAIGGGDREDAFEEGFAEQPIDAYANEGQHARAKEIQEPHECKQRKGQNE